MTMQFLMNLSDGMDLNALQKCFPTLDGARSNRLRIDGIPLPEGARTGRDYAILLNPEGLLIRRILRRNMSKHFIIGDPTDGEKIVFSVDLIQPIQNYELEFDNMIQPIFGDNRRLFSFNPLDELNQSPLDTLMTRTHSSMKPRSRSKRQLTGNFRNPWRLDSNNFLTQSWKNTWLKWTRWNIELTMLSRN